MTRPGLPPTTEEHRPPTAEQADRGRPVLLAAFPESAALPTPPLGKPVGRLWLADAGIVDAKVSGQHLAFMFEGGRWKVEDLGSRNFTYRNGHRLEAGTKVPIEDGTVLRIGGTLLVFREAYRGPLRPVEPLGSLVGPFGLTDVRAAVAAIGVRRMHPVLIEGPTGTGKEALAQEVARALGRLHKYTAVNVAGIPETLFEGQLFGWERGAFSGSVEARPGVLRSHHGGAVFLDELGELPTSSQPKLLRVLDGHGVMSLGGARELPVDVAIVAATNRDLTECVERGTFRRDLLARFTYRVRLPSLAKRPEDLFAMMRALWERRYGQLDFGRMRVDVEAVELLMLQGWPGNVRDLDRVVASMDPGMGIKLSAVEQVLGVRASPAAPPPTVEAIEKAIAEAGNKSEAARRLGISRGYLQRRLDEKKGK
ncbi:sigma 54-interacting transcriptional regulator [Polyangium spumosum]|uniref:FHA domain-containing protein n=1 Tax=Polyangium spumosum TaxID=889282 RepID=A0A6N7Q1H6_9BACT|nr:sigma 54-interacting transcriptional regulator [Polyangium spumosum]MRG98168.1 FHA domain-containing protein [Polyangium spumosum]